MSRRTLVAVAALAASFALASPSLAAPWDLPCDIGPIHTLPGTLSSGTNGQRQDNRVLEMQRRVTLDRGEAITEWKRQAAGLTRWADSDDGLNFFALNELDGFSFNYRWFLGIDFAFYEFDKFDGDPIPEIQTNVGVLEFGRQFGRTKKRGSRVGIRLPYVDYHDEDTTGGGPFSASDFFDVELFGDFGFSWEDGDSDDNVLHGLLLETRVTFPTGDEDVALGREGMTIGLRPRWFRRWHRIGEKGTDNQVEVQLRGDRGSVRLTQVHVSAGLGYVYDEGISELSFWSPVVGVMFGWNDRTFLDLELQGELHDDGPDQYDLFMDVAVRLRPASRRHQVFLSAGGVLALNDEGLRDRFAPTVGVKFLFGADVGPSRR